MKTYVLFVHVKITSGCEGTRGIFGPKEKSIHGLYLIVLQ